MPVVRSQKADQALAAVLRRLRQERGATQEEIAFHAGLTTRSLQKIELGQSSPEWSTVRRVADALEINLVDLAKAVEAAAAGASVSFTRP